jgi:hypothetical protein
MYCLALLQRTSNGMGSIFWLATPPEQEQLGKQLFGTGILAPSFWRWPIRHSSYTAQEIPKGEPRLHLPLRKTEQGLLTV